MILALRTDNPEAEIYVLDQGAIRAKKLWVAGRELSEQLLSEIYALLDSVNSKPRDIQAVLVYQGPGSFTGLRIGISVANAIGYSLEMPVVGASGNGWLETGAELAQKANTNGQKFQPLQPEYGAQPHITQPRK